MMNYIQTEPQAEYLQSHQTHLTVAACSVRLLIVSLLFGGLFNAVFSTTQYRKRG
jgi:hypothetical protein